MPKAKKAKLKQVLSNFRQRQAKAHKQQAAKEWLAAKADSIALGKQRKKPHKSQRSKAATAAQVRVQERLEAQLYTQNDTILLVGEGNFSFARSLVEHHLGGQGSQLVATAYDDAETAKAKYDKEVDANTEVVKVAEATVLFGVDGMDLAGCKPLRNRRFTRIVFNFPHAGAGIKDQDRNIRVNQELLLAFFASAKSFLTSREYGDTVNGEIHVSLKSGEPYDSWQVRKLARTHSLECTRSMAFRTECYPGYTHRRTLGFKEGVSASGNEEIMDKNPRMLIFARKNFDHTNIKKSATKGAKTRRSEVQQHPDHSDDDDSD